MVVVFYGLFSILILQRIFELAIARRNENWMRSKGAIEFGQEHYKYIVTLHSLFFISLFFEVTVYEKGLSQVWPILLSLLIITQFLRVWVITTLGRYWNTKIIVLEGAKVKNNGPFRYFKHPNYFVVCLEFFIIPMLFEAYATALLFSIANAFLLFKIRIPQEEAALIKETNYSTAFLNTKKNES